MDFIFFLISSLYHDHFAVGPLAVQLEGNDSIFLPGQERNDL